MYNQSVAEAQKMKGFDSVEVAKNREMAIKVIRITTLSGVVMFNLAVGIGGALMGAVIKLMTDSAAINKK